MLHAVIVAGGRGTRLWPVSRTSDPKQLRPFADGETLLRRTFERVRKIVPAERIWIETNAVYADEVLVQLPELDPARLILEPMGRNTAAAVGLGAVVLAKFDPDATMMNVWSDHYVKNEDEYQRQILNAEKALEQYPEYLIDVVARPEYPATGFGYLQSDGELTQIDGTTVYKSAGFVEKPDLATAEKYLAAGNYYWNTAMFIWKTDTLLKLYERFKPAMYLGLKQIQAAWGTADHERVINEVFPKLESVAIDYAIFEQAPNIALIPADMGWRDVGSWQAVYDVLSKAATGVSWKGRVSTIDTHDSLIFNENEGKLVAVVGMSDVVVVDTLDALLVMKKSKDQDIKKIVTELEDTGEVNYL
ncbi:MAG: mannose-1-phosphate guanylyltransferase [bacterium]